MNRLVGEYPRIDKKFHLALAVVDEGQRRDCARLDAEVAPEPFA
ncbi:MAG: hypothetical protein M5U09_08020 [Gammaproteobacteria bacterium]|nr:hypothetical protein [Gammaproteobacteria bacterium]